MTLVGIDEAGRGPVIGPLVIAGVKINEKDNAKLKALGVKDSKKLSKNEREFLEAEIKKLTEYKILVIQPKEIDKALKSQTLNLNLLEAEKAIKIINDLDPKKAILDCPSTNIKAFQEYVQKKTDAKIECYHKADENHPTVAAASILAKVTRDKEIEKLKSKHNIDFGSGYPSDEKTQNFLKINYNKYDFFRTTWESYKNVVKEKEQSSLSSFGE